VLPTKKHLVCVVSFWTFFKYLGNHSELEKPKPGVSFKVKLNNLLFCCKNRKIGKPYPNRIWCPIKMCNLYSIWISSFTV